MSDNLEVPDLVIEAYGTVTPPSSTDDLPDEGEEAPS